MQFLFFALIFCAQYAMATTDCNMQPCKYVRAGASGNNSGNDWNNAFSDLPAALSRGTTYFVADGSYASHTFADANANSVKITIKKALPSDHGSSIGWSDSYAIGQSVFGDFTFRTSDYVIDGQRRNENDWFDKAAYGFSIGFNSSQRQIIIQNYGKIPKNIVVKYAYLPGWSASMPNTTQRIYAVDVDDYDGGSTSTGLVFHRMFVSGSNNVWFLRTTEGAIVEYSASDGVAGNGTNHGEIVNLYYSGSNAIIRYNKFRNAYLNGGGTALVAITQANGLQFYGNVAWNFQVGDGAVGFLGGDASNCRIYNNTFVKAIFAAGFASDGTNNLVYNNLWVDNRAVNISGTHNYNAFSDSDSRDEPNAQINVPSSIFVNASAADFRLARPTSPGSPLLAPYDIDLLEKARGADGAWDRGAFEYNGNPSPSPSPSPKPSPVPSPSPSPSPKPSPAPSPSPSPVPSPLSPINSTPQPAPASISGSAGCMQTKTNQVNASMSLIWVLPIIGLMRRRKN